MTIIKKSQLLSCLILLCISRFAVAETAFVHLFEWRWESIAEECETFLGPKGFTAVQISPPQEHLDHPTWWARYQPVSLTKLTSRSGTEAELREMIERCHKAGVKIYADVVINNWANLPDASRVGSGGSAWSSYEYPDLTRKDFHTPACGIDNYTRAETVWHCELYGMPDLDTGAAKPQAYVADYMKRLTAMGVAGFRMDAAKHIAPQDLRAILTKAGQPWIFAEVIGTPGEAPEIHPRHYMELGNSQSRVTEFSYGTVLARAFEQNIASLREFPVEDFLPDEKAVVFVDNHDRERGHGGEGNLTYKEGTRYRLANVFMLAHPYGYPAIMSGYQFTDTDVGPPPGATDCSNRAWVCQHRWPEVANMLAFRQHVNGTTINHWWDNGKNQIAFARGNKGFVVINNDGKTLKRKIQTGLAAGRYCNILADLKPCSSEVIEVDRRGYAHINLKAHAAVAIYTDTRVKK